MASGTSAKSERSSADDISYKMLPLKSLWQAEVSYPYFVRVGLCNVCCFQVKYHFISSGWCMVIYVSLYLYG